MTLQPKPDSKKYTDLISEIQKWHIKIPKFQRNFVWSLDKTAKLLDSILKGYPIGTFILWETSERLNDIKNIWNLELPPVPDGTKIQYVLDGQQRLTSLYAAFRGATIQKEWEKKITDYNEIFVDLDKDIENDEQIVVDEKPEWNYITLHKILNSLDFDEEIEDNFEKEMRRKIRKYAQTFNTYDFSTVVLRREDIDSAIEVFTRINTWGQTLTLFEIMSAKTYDESENFDMTDRYNKLMEELSDRKYNTISSSVLLQVISLILSKSKECKRKTILQLDKQEIINIWDDVISAIKETVDYFRSVYRIPVSSILPYDALVVLFTYFFYNQKIKPTWEQAKYMEEFFWRMSLSSRYWSGTEWKLAQDAKRIDTILDHQRPSYDEIKLNLDSPRDLIEANFSTGSSFGKAIVCLLAYQEPKDFQDNGKIILDNSRLKSTNSRNYHHFFPKAYLKKNNIWNANSVVNITLVSADLNKRTIRAKAPSIYIKDLIEENESLPKSLESHLISNIDSFWITSDDYDIFLEQRAKAMLSELNKRINLKNASDNQPNKIRELIDKWENEMMEMKSTLRYDLNLNEVNKKLEFVVMKTISAFLNSEWWTLLIWVDDDWVALWLDKDLSTLSKDNLDWLELHLSQLTKKYLGWSFEKYVKISFEKLDSKDICKIKVMRSGKPVFIKKEWDEHFYVRNGNESIPKSRAEQSEYVKLHWW